MTSSEAMKIESPAPQESMIQIGMLQRPAIGIGIAAD
jgi:hypothetical protein